MPIKEVISPVSTTHPNSKVGSNPPRYRSGPAPGMADSVPAQPSGGRASRHNEEPAASLQVTGPTEED